MATETVVEKGHQQETATELWEGGKSPFKASYGKLMMWYFLLSDAFTFAGFLIAYGALRFSSAAWPVPDYVFKTVPFGGHMHAPLVFVTFMTFVLIVSSVTMVRAVQEGQQENQRGVFKWILFTIVGGGIFLGCQAWEWQNLIVTENMSIYTNPFSMQQVDGTYLEDANGKAYEPGVEKETFKIGDGYLIHGHGAGENFEYIQRKYEFVNPETGVKEVSEQQFGPKAFGALFFFITGFHGFHVFSGLVFLSIIAMNVASGVYVKRKNGYEMVEKVGLYWHFVDLVWVFVFLVFYLL